MRTDRLQVRFIREEDWRSIQAIWEDFKQTEYVFYDTCKNTEDEEVKNRIAKWAHVTRSGKDHLFFAVCLDGEVIGYTSLNIREGGYEIGYGFRNKAQGRGYAKESLCVILDYMKSLGTEKIYAGTALKNTPSVRLLKCLGFELTGTETLSFHKDSDGNEVYFDGGLFEKYL